MGIGGGEASPVAPRQRHSSGQRLVKLSQGKVLGTLIGALILGVISDGMRLTDVKYDTQLIVFGSVIVVAVLVDKLKSRDWRMLRG